MPCLLSILLLTLGLLSAGAQTPSGVPDQAASASELEQGKGKGQASKSVTEFPADATFTPVPLGAQGRIGDGMALFAPTGLGGADGKTLPASICLLRPPEIQGPLPADWKLVPTFSQSGDCHRAVLAIPPGADLYGGGEVVGPLRRNGTTIKLWNTDNMRYKKDGGSRLYQSHPWIMGVLPDGSAFGVLFDTTWKAELSCKESITFTARGEAFPVIVVRSDTPAGVLRELGQMTGRMELPPRWALGYQQCRWSYYPESQVREIAQGFRSRRIPCDVIWLDIDYMDGYRCFTFNKSYFPDPKGLNDYLHSLGFKSIWMIDPGIKVDNSYGVYTDGRAKDVYVKKADGSEFRGTVWPGACAFPDYTRPETREWWSNLFRDYMAVGIDGVWNDMNEPAVFRGEDGTMPEDNLHRGGEGLPPGPHLRYHNAYGMLMARATREGILKANPDKRPFVLTRSNFLGGQRYAATWTGDNASSDYHMKVSVPMSLTLGLSGQPFSGPDLGGFADKPDARIWSQWVGTGVFLPFARGHGIKREGSKEPWSFGPQVEKTARIAIERRYRLLPYLYTLFEEASRTGIPVMRPLFMADSKDSALRAEERAFLLGGDIMVIPPWATATPLPKPSFLPISLVEGDTTDPDQASLRIRPGAIVPLGKVVQNTTENSLDPLTLLVAFDERGEATGTLYEDAGEGFGYRKGEYRLTHYHALRANGQTQVTVTSTEGNLPPVKRTIQIQTIDSNGKVTPTTQEL